MGEEKFKKKPVFEAKFNEPEAIKGRIKEAKFTEKEAKSTEVRVKQADFSEKEAGAIKGRVKHLGFSEKEAGEIKVGRKDIPVKVTEFKTGETITVSNKEMIRKKVQGTEIIKSIREGKGALKQVMAGKGGSITSENALKGVTTMPAEEKASRITFEEMERARKKKK